LYEFKVNNTQCHTSLLYLTALAQFINANNGRIVSGGQETVPIVQDNTQVVHLQEDTSGATYVQVCIFLKI